MKIYGLHGNTQNKNIFKKINLDNFESLNLPGHGGEETIDYYSLENYALFINAKILEPCILFGHSLGGHVALEIARKNKLVKGLITLAAPPLSDTAISKAYLAHPGLQCLFEESPSIEQIEMFCRAHGGQEDDIQMLIDAVKQQDPKARVTLMDSFSKGISPEIEKLRELTIPSMYILGEEEKFVDKSFFIENNSISEILMMNGGHNLMLDYPREFEEVILKFASKV